MKVLITQQFKRPDNSDIETLKHQLALLMMNKNYVLPQGIHLASKDDCEQGDGFYIEVVSFHEIEEAFRFHFTGSRKYEILVKSTYRNNAKAIFGKYLKNVSLLSGNAFLDEAVQDQWNAWLRNYAVKYNYSTLLDNQT